MKRLSKNQIDDAIEDNIMFETVEQQRAVKERHEKELADKSHTWG